ncbi:23377_t:CDS:2 [Gigaspora rosea]|nr:23377_t:CDS:2 [Gigaspora rosea]
MKALIEFRDMMLIILFKNFNHVIIVDPKSKKVGETDEIKQKLFDLDFLCEIVKKLLKQKLANEIVELIENADEYN